MRFPKLRSGLLVLVVFLLSFVLSACTIPRVTAEERIFLPLSLEFLGEYRLPKMEMFEGTPVGGLSGITYDRQRDRFYVLTDDRSELAPARFYTFKIEFNPKISDFDRTQPQKAFKAVEIEKVTLLKNEKGATFDRGTIDPEGIALSPQNSVFISSEGIPHAGIPPFVQEFDLETGNWRQSLPIPPKYLSGQDESVPSGVQENLGFEALTIPAGYGSTQLEPFRVFTATEAALIQDQDGDRPGPGSKSRLLHYLVGESLPVVISEHLYPIEPLPEGAETIGLTELVTVDPAGHFLSLERSYGSEVGTGVRIYQVATGGATDVSAIASLKGDLNGIQPVQKKLLLDLSDLNIRLDNSEGMTLGPRLGDGSQSLLVISDDNFRKTQVNQILLFRLKK